MHHEYSIHRHSPSTSNIEVPVQAQTPASLTCPRCGVIDAPRVTPGKGPHSFRANCAHCGSFLQWVSRYTHEERVHRREQFRREAMRQLLPTPTQLAYLLSLGYKGEMPATRHDASTSIDECLRQRAQASQGEGRA